MPDSRPPATDITPSFLLGLMYRTLKAISRNSHEQGYQHHAKMRVLTTISLHQRISQNDLLAELGLRASSLSEMIGKLEEEGLIAKERNVLDKRAYMVSMTDKGNATTEEHLEKRQAYADAVFAEFAEDEYRQMGTLLMKLVDVLEKGQDIGGKNDPVRGRSRYSALEPYAIENFMGASAGNSEPGA